MAYPFLNKFWLRFFLITEEFIQDKVMHSDQIAAGS